VVLVRFHDQFQPRAGVLAAELGAEVVQRSPIGIHKLALNTRESVEAAVARIRRDPRVRYAEPNHRIELLNTPNDPRHSECWGLNNTGQAGGTADADIDAEEAWDISIGSWDVVVAVLDTGVDYDHPDLAANIWTNEDEIGGNGVDDDENGYIDSTTCAAGTSSSITTTRWMTTVTAPIAPGPSARWATTTWAWPGSTGGCPSCRCGSSATRGWMPIAWTRPRPFTTRSTTGLT
jgi:subtilisin family serine protease